jgi:addiction module HigA family antidote
MQMKTPGIVLKDLLKKHGLNCNRLAKAINMSNAMVRLLVLDKSPVSLSAAFRLAKFFKTKPEFWIDLQMKLDLENATKDKALAKELSEITDVGNYSFVRKPHAVQKGKRMGKGKKKATLADKRKAAGKVPGAKPTRRAKRK